MSKYAKGLVEVYYAKTLRDAQIKDFLVVSLVGINGVVNNQIRTDLRQKGIRLLMVKNPLFVRALRNVGMEAAAGLFEGPCVVAFSADSAVDVARELLECKKKVEALQIKGAYFEGAVLGAAQAAALAKMPTLKELKSMVAAAICGPGSGVSAVVAGMGAALGGCVRSLAEKLEKQAA